MAVGILIEAEDTPTAEEGTPKKSAAVGSDLREAVAMLTGSSDRQGRSRSDGAIARAVEVGCNQMHS